MEKFTQFTYYETENQCAGFKNIFQGTTLAVVQMNFNAVHIPIIYHLNFPAVLHANFLTAKFNRYHDKN